MSENPAPEQPTLFDDPDDDSVEDVAGELDDPVPLLDETASDVDDAEEAPLYHGVCRDGPYDGRVMTSRFPQGFLLVDRPGKRMWLYGFDNGLFTCQPKANVTDAERMDIADGEDYDVIAYESEGAA